MEFRVLPEAARIIIRLFDTVWATDFHCPIKQHELLYVLSGQMNLILQDNQVYPVKTGDILLIPQGVQHKDDFPFERDLKIMIIHFSWPYFAEFAEKIGNSRINQMSQDTRQELNWIFERLRDDFGTGKLDDAVNNTRLANILALIYREFNHKSTPVPPVNARQKLAGDIRHYINLNFGTIVHVDDVASHFKLSSFYLSRVFREETNFSLMEYLTEVRINEAKKLLRNGRLLIAEVAQAVGFRDGNYFSKVFRRSTGCSPSKFR